MPEEVTLTLTELIGRGYYRECWLHPHDARLCIKTPRAKGKTCPQCEADAHNYPRLVRKGLAGLHVPRIIGWVASNRGKGLVSERVLDDCGTPSLTIAQAARKKIINADETLELIGQLYRTLYRKNVIVRDNNMHNMMVRNRSPIGRHLVVVDGVGHPAMGVKSVIRDSIPIFGRYRLMKELDSTKRFLDELFESIAAEGKTVGSDLQRKAA